MESESARKGGVDKKKDESYNHYFRRSIAD